MSPAQGLATASKPQSWTYDSSFMQKTDIKDQASTIIVKAGAEVNPLEKTSWGELLILIDGDDKTQVAWATAKSRKLVLTNGSPIELIEELNKQVF
ncbi:MAG: hypothetical protein MTP17_00350 [Candidatus Midichloria sp.]|nr:MAG: hypothetical protein MTP17_00350 [Candidatus Midichloria sp.]